METKLIFHPASEKPEKSGDYLCILSGIVLDIHYSKRHDAWNVFDSSYTDDHNMDDKVRAWTEIPTDILDIMNADDENELQ